jgi:transposase-like protein
MQPQPIGRRRRRTSAVQRAHLIELFQRSNLTRGAFARRHGVGISTLGKWLTDARATSHRPAPVVFREMQLAGVAPATATPWAMEVEGFGGLTIRCREALSLQDLAALLREPAC